MSYAPKILTVDDEPHMCDSLKVLLTNEGYEVHTACSGNQALECLAKNDFDLVLLDIVMPDVNGHQVMDYINSREPETCVIVITGHATVDSAIESLRRGAYDYLRKPFEHEELLKTAKNALDGKRLKSDRKRTEEELRSAHRKLQATFDAIQDCMNVVDLDFNLTDANDVLIKRFGLPAKESVLGRKCYEVMKGRKDICPDCAVAETYRTKTAAYRTFTFEDKASTGGRSFEIFTYPIMDEHGTLSGVVECVRDITERKRVERALMESEKKYRQVAENLNEGIWLIDKDACTTFVNPCMAEILGYTVEEMQGKHLFSFLDEEGVKLCKRNMECRKQGIKEQHDCEFVRKDGTRIFVSLQTSPITDDDGKYAGAIAGVSDITERKRAEEQIRRLSHQLMTAQEAERQRISYELHDVVGQQLSALMIGLDTFFDNQPEPPPEMRQRLSELSKMLQDGIVVVRNLSYTLRSTGLDQRGLVPAALRYCEEFSDKNRVKVDFFSAGINESKLDFDTKINLYRVIQEGLNNIKKHAAASHVTVRLIGSFPRIILRIEDNGKGFDVQNRLLSAANEKHMGLRIMEERVALLNGKMRVESRPKQGTKIIIEVPYNLNVARNS